MHVYNDASLSMTFLYICFKSKCSLKVELSNDMIFYFTFFWQFDEETKFHNKISRSVLHLSPSSQQSTLAFLNKHYSWIQYSIYMYFVFEKLGTSYELCRLKEVYINVHIFSEWTELF